MLCQSFQLPFCLQTEDILLQTTVRSFKSIPILNESTATQLRHSEKAFSLTYSNCLFPGHLHVMQHSMSLCRHKNEAAPKKNQVVIINLTFGFKNWSNKETRLFTGVGS